MADAEMSPSVLLARLLVEASLDNIAGKAQGKFPVDGKPLSEDERARLNRTGAGTTLMYLASGTAVFFDLQGSATSIWFSNADSSGAAAIVDAALKRAYPKATIKADGAHPTDPLSRQRSYDVPLGPDRVAVVDVGYPAPGQPMTGFLVRVLAYARKAN